MLAQRPAPRLWEALTKERAIPQVPNGAATVCCRLMSNEFFTPNRIDFMMGRWAPESILSGA